MNVLFVHPRGAGQFRHLAAHLAATGSRATIVCEEQDITIPGVRFVRHAGTPARAPATPDLSHLGVADRMVQHAYRVAETLSAIRRGEAEPDLVVGHIGWGSLLFVGEALPRTSALGYCEYYFNRVGGDLGFDPDNPVTIAELGRARVRNFVQRATLEAVAGGLSPTAWQRSRYPAALRSRIAVCHEGIDTLLCAPSTDASFPLPDGRVLKAGDRVVTYAARGLEPYRGFPQFMRAAARVARQRKDITFVVAGDDSVAYGRPAPNGRSWREHMLAETGVDPSRVVFLGAIDHGALVRLFQVSAAHVYLTVPFVLSWSVLEAMACGALVIGSKTEPVEEVVTDGQNGILVDFFDSDALAAQIVAAVDRPAPRATLRRAARATVERRYGRSEMLARQTTLLANLAGRAGSARFG